LVHRQKYTIFGVVTCIVVISIIGLYRIHTVTYMVDDIPDDSKIKQDIEADKIYLARKSAFRWTRDSHAGRDRL